ncbi:MAG: hypothetical protein ACJ8IQ_10535 [Chthoniobacterales bacterium]
MAEQAARKLGYEPRDVNVRAVVWFAVGLVVSAIIIHLALGGLFVLFKRQHPSPDAPSRIVLQPRVVAPEPRLQPNPVPEFSRFRTSEEEELNSYGWINKERGIVRIPIERAIDLIAQRGLPTRGPGTNNSSGITPEQLQQQKAAATAPKP